VLLFFMPISTNGHAAIMRVTEHASHVWRARCSRGRRRIIDKGAAMGPEGVVAAIVYAVFSVAVAKFIGD
jgi:hypothetical protein